ncbi:MAG TPA: HEXXH motif-containing putative peptide modification protein [Nitrospira sp.]|nr:HEXXH motif-containing putative peptide modification protein [Nitrospira sp.]
MKRLVLDLCRELTTQYAGFTREHDVPTDYFRFVACALDDDDYGNWPIVGWAEALNDLVYFVDLLEQLKKEDDPREFAEQLFAECQTQFFEHSYLDELFPSGRPNATGLASRLQGLCMRLAQEVTQASLFFDARWPMRWNQRRAVTGWKVHGSLEQQVETAVPALALAVGTRGDYVVVPRGLIPTIDKERHRVRFEIGRTTISLTHGDRVPLCTLRGNELEWHWPIKPAMEALKPDGGSLTVGPTLRYGHDRRPESVIPTHRKQIERIARAWDVVRRAWPEGHQVLALLTRRIVPLRAKGVVSFSFRHRPGLSFINCFDRDNLDLIDDLVHENSHHHLNLLLRKHVMYHHDANQQIFYSPWRRSLRPIRGILHAAFTFTMGAVLFERLSSWAESPAGMQQWQSAGLTKDDAMRARFRCLEEIESVRYSVEDLEYAGHRLKWLTRAGAGLVRQLGEALFEAEQRIGRHRAAVMRSRFGAALRKHRTELEQARRIYRPGR